jgi:hypothetical protein
MELQKPDPGPDI